MLFSIWEIILYIYKDTPKFMEGTQYVHTRGNDYALVYCITTTINWISYISAVHNPHPYIYINIYIYMYIYIDIYNLQHMYLLTNMIESIPQNNLQEVCGVTD
jgi:hypothetical protein